MVLDFHTFYQSNIANLKLSVKGPSERNNGAITVSVERKIFFYSTAAPS